MLQKIYDFLNKQTINKNRKNQKLLIYNEEEMETFDNNFQKLNTIQKQTWADTLINTIYYLIQKDQDQQAKQTLTLLIMKGYQNHVKIQDEQLLIQMVKYCWIDNRQLTKRQRNKNIELLTNQGIDITLDKNIQTNRQDNKNFLRDLFAGCFGCCA